MDDHSLLAGTRVVEAANYVSGPFTGMMLAHLGAEVVKVEPSEGDPVLRYGIRHERISALWVNVNHGKRILHHDLRSNEGQRAIHSLLENADVFLQNWRPGVADSMGLGADELCARYPRLIWTGISGFGPNGPRAGAPAFDPLIQATTGLSDFEAIGGNPTWLRSALADKVTSAYAVQTILAALLNRSRTGRGARIDLSMLDVMAYFNFPDVGRDRTFLAPEAAVNLPAGRSAVVKTSDGYLTIAPVSGRQFKAALEAVGHPEWMEDLKRTNNVVELTNLLYDRLESITRTAPTSEWEERFRQFDVPATAVLTKDEHMDDVQTIHNAIYSEIDSSAGRIRRVRYPAVVDGQELLPVPAPDLQQ
jgi:crotonobetainyl-CoA:carnitine CoA-transferase CaiB-like acyl-CoA transferase